MASHQEGSSSYSSISNPTQRTWKYDIFLSFRGEDTRRGFVSHLYHALMRSGFRVFIDDEELRRGEVISQELLQAIEESRIAIVIISENYASSSWCLDELQHILASQINQGQLVLPIFYDVTPSDVRKQQGSFGQGLAKLEKKLPKDQRAKLVQDDQSTKLDMHQIATGIGWEIFQEEEFGKPEMMFQRDQSKVQKWRRSLTEAANLAGFDSSSYRTEAELIDTVVEHLCKLRSKLAPVSRSEALIGIEWRVDEIFSLLEIGLDDVRFIGIWGMGGAGKTTLARAIHERFHHQFDFHYFFANVREVSERNGLLHLQNQLLSCLNIRNFQIENTGQGKSILGQIFQNRKVMLILDDVNHLSQLENLVGSRGWFGHGSRIIITTRDANLLRIHPVDEERPPGVDEIYEVKLMNEDESLQLFYQKAFRGDSPTKSLLELAELVIIYAHGLPLALCVLGSFLSRQSEEEWKDALGMLKKDSNNDIFKVLRLSYDALNQVEKTIFLHIACFFNMWGRDEVTQILESCGLEAKIGMNNLIAKSLLVEIEFGNTKYIEMHDLVQEMGRLIVFDESPDELGRRSRLWYSYDIDQVLQRNMGTKATKGVVLPFTFEKDEANWEPTSFLRMHLLQLLIISCNFSLPRGIMGFPWTIKVLHWYGYASKTFPSMEEMDQLEYLKMQNSKIKKLSIDIKSMYELRILDLSHSRNLLETPKFFGFQNLKRLVLEGCISLVEIHSSLGQLPFLVEVNLKGCLNLKVLPKKLETRSLEEFLLCECIQVRNLPEFGEEMKNLRTLDVKGTSITKLPCNFHKLKSLKVLDVSGCSSFIKLPENFNENEALEKLDASGTAIEEVPSSICYLKKLKTMTFHGCKKPNSNSSIWSLTWNSLLQRHSSFANGLKFPTSIFTMGSLTELDLSYCGIVDGIIPDDLSGLSSLQKLDLSGNEFVNLPENCISNLLNLKYLYLNSCPKIELLPQPSPGLNLMDAGGCGSLRTLSNQKFLHLFASMKQDGQHAGGSMRDASFSLTIPGGEMPTWFCNQNHLLLNEKHEAFETIDIHEVDDLLGIALCTVIDENIYLPRWGLDLKSSNGKYMPYVGRTREDEKEIKSSHLWIVFWKIKEESEMLANCEKIRLKFCTGWEQQPSSSLVGAQSVKCGWCFICGRDGMTWQWEEEHSQLA